MGSLCSRMKQWLESRSIVGSSSCGAQWAFNPAAEETLEALVHQGRVDAEAWCA